MGTSWFYGERDYRAIEEALLRSDYGRWFLGEYLDRNRSEETRRLFDAVERLESSLGEGAETDRLRAIALEIDTALGDALERIEPAPPEAGWTPPVETILEAVEDINGFLESMSTRRAHQRLPEKIHSRLGDIQRSCAQVDRDSEAAQTLAGVLAGLRTRLAAVGAELEAGDADAPEIVESSRCFPRQLFDELAAAFSPYAEAPAGG